MSRVARGDWVLIWIGIFKLVKVSALAAFGIAALALRHSDIASDLREWADALGVDPRNRHLDELLSTASGLSPKELEEIGIGSLVYAALFAVEGCGLIARKVWAEYLTVFITTSFLPLEAYELVHRASVVKGVVIAANLASAVYLIWRLRRDRRWPFRRPKG